MQPADELAALEAELEQTRAERDKHRARENEQDDIIEQQSEWIDKLAEERDAALAQARADRATLEAYKEATGIVKDVAHVDGLNAAIHKEAERAARLEAELRIARELMSTLIVDPTLPEHLRTNTHKVLAAVMKTAKERDTLRAEAGELAGALEKARQFIANGIEFGYIGMPDKDTPDSAHETLPLAEAVLARYRAAHPEPEPEVTK